MIVISISLSATLKKSSEREDHIAILKSQFLILGTMGSSVQNFLNVNILLSSLSELIEHDAVFVSIYLFPESKTLQLL